MKTIKIAFFVFVLIGTIAQQTQASPELFEACSNGNLEQVKKLLENGADINSKDRNGNTPFHEAIYKEHKKIAELLINKGANVNGKNNYGCSPLLAAVIGNDKDIVELLINKDADINIKNNYGYTPLYMAASTDSKKMVELLLQNKAKINEKNNYGNTPLHVAANHGYKNIVELLIKNGANVNIENNDGSTPLHKTICNNHKDILELLINNGANMNIENNDGNTPLHEAIYREKFVIAAYLISKGAKIDKRACIGLRNGLSEITPEQLNSIFKSALPISFESNPKDSTTDTNERIFIDFGTQELGEKYKNDKIIEYPEKSILPNNPLVVGDHKKRMDVLCYLLKNLFAQDDEKFVIRNLNSLSIKHPGKYFEKLINCYLNNIGFASKQDFNTRVKLLLLAQAAWKKWNTPSTPKNLCDMNIKFQQKGSFVKFEEIPTKAVDGLK